MNEDSLSKIVKNNRKKILRDYGNIIRTLNSCVEKQNYLITDYCSNVDFSYKNDQYPILKGIVYKNSLNLHSTLELITMGYHSSASILLRNVFEGLIIIIQVIKYNDVDLYNQFVEGADYIKPVKKILNNKKVPKNIKDEIKNLWKYLCKKSHSSTSTMQIGLDYDQTSYNKELVNKNQIDFILGLFTLLTDMNWILSDDYIFDQVCKYIASEGNKVKNKYKQYNYRYNFVKKASKKYRKNYTESAISFINFLEE